MAWPHWSRPRYLRQIYDTEPDRCWLLKSLHRCAVHLRSLFSLRSALWSSFLHQRCWVICENRRGNRQDTGRVWLIQANNTMRAAITDAPLSKCCSLRAPEHCSNYVHVHCNSWTARQPHRPTSASDVSISKHRSICSSFRQIFLYFVHSLAPPRRLLLLLSVFLRTG